MTVIRSRFLTQKPSIAIVSCGFYVVAGKCVLTWE